MFDKKTLEYILDHGMISFSDNEKAYSDIKKFLGITDKIYDISIEDAVITKALSTDELLKSTPQKSDINKSEFIIPKVVQ